MKQLFSFKNKSFPLKLFIDDNQSDIIIREDGLFLYLLIYRNDIDSWRITNIETEEEDVEQEIKGQTKIIKRGLPLMVWPSS